jgi:serine/threonine protein kinase
VQINDFKVKFHKMNSYKEDVILTGKQRKYDIQKVEQFLDLLSKLLVYEPEGRIDAKTALRHSFFR